jgi:hypothetical protein
MKIRESIVPIVVSILVGTAVLKWEWLANASGLQIHVDRGNSMLTFEYAVGLIATFLLGYTFPHCGGGLSDVKDARRAYVLADALRRLSCTIGVTPSSEMVEQILSKS